MCLLASKSLVTGLCVSSVADWLSESTASDEERGACTPAGSISVVLVKTCLDHATVYYGPMVT